MYVYVYCFVLEFGCNCGLFTIAYGAVHNIIDARLRIARHEHVNQLLHEQVTDTRTGAFGQLEYGL